jgi:D-arabinose 1-dehydrogenase-like Zn-dependent alcohol dehydrogenase
MCGGITAYKPLAMYSKPGDMVGVVGLGGIGCMAVQFAKASGCKVTVFSTSKRKEAQAMEMGVDKFVVTSDPDSLATAENSCNMILYTPNKCQDLMPFINCLYMKGKMAFIGAVTEPPALPLFGPPIMKDLVFAGSHIGGPKLIKEMVELVASKDIRCPVSVHPFAEINECLDSMRNNTHDARFVLKNTETDFA